jgi:large subunit ribosomal protein L31e
MAEELERIYVVPLKFTKRPGSRRAQLAIQRVKQFLSRHMKVEEEKVWIANSLNQAIWTKGKYKTPSKLRIRAIRFSDGQVEASLPGEPTHSYREEIKEKKEGKKAPAKKKGKEKEVEELAKVSEKEKATKEKKVEEVTKERERKEEKKTEEATKVSKKVKK